LMGALAPTQNSHVYLNSDTQIFRIKSGDVIMNRIKVSLEFMIKFL
jgi:hypothetical protein